MLSFKSYEVFLVVCYNYRVTSLVSDLGIQFFRKTQLYLVTNWLVASNATGLVILFHSLPLMIILLIKHPDVSKNQSGQR